MPRAQRLEKPETLERVKAIRRGLQKGSSWKEIASEVGGNANDCRQLYRRVRRKWPEEFPLPADLMQPQYTDLQVLAWARRAHNGTPFRQIAEELGVKKNVIQAIVHRRRKRKPELFQRIDQEKRDQEERQKRKALQWAALNQGGLRWTSIAKLEGKPVARILAQYKRMRVKHPALQLPEIKRHKAFGVGPALQHSDTQVLDAYREHLQGRSWRQIAEDRNLSYHALRGSVRHRMKIHPELFPKVDPATDRRPKRGRPRTSQPQAPSAAPEHMNALYPGERKVVEMHYGIGEFDKPHSDREIAKALKMSQAQARRIRREALRKTQQAEEGKR